MKKFWLKILIYLIHGITLGLIPLANKLKKVLEDLETNLEGK